MFRYRGWDGVDAVMSSEWIYLRSLEISQESICVLTSPCLYFPKLNFYTSWSWWYILSNITDGYFLILLFFYFHKLLGVLSIGWFLLLSQLPRAYAYLKTKFIFSADNSCDLHEKWFYYFFAFPKCQNLYFPTSLWLFCFLQLSNGMCIIQIARLHFETFSNCTSQCNYFFRTSRTKWFVILLSIL
jgi:hypothetical protein